MLTQVEKDEFKRQRLHQYAIQLYTLEMDVVAYGAMGNEQARAQIQQEIEKVKAAQAAIKAMK